MAANAYDTAPYPDLSYVNTHPDHMAVLARLLGLSPAPVATARVLEIGCAGGGNLIPLAYALPQARFVGFDYSARQIEDGRQRVARLGLTNIELICRDLTTVGDELGMFDFIISHGVYSWTPPDVRDCMLALIKRLLRPQGVAFVSYNTYPGWHITGLVRDVMLLRAGEIADPKEKAQAARTALRFMAEHVADTAYGAIFRSYHDFLQDGLKATDDAFLLHDELEETNDPVYFTQFVEHAERHGLQYLVEAELREVLPHMFKPETQAALQEMARSTLEMEQWMDFLRNRMFRQTLLVHADAPVRRSLHPQPVMALWARARAQHVEPPAAGAQPGTAQFASQEGATLTTDHPVTIAAMQRLGQVWPRGLHFSELLSAATQSDLAQAHPPRPGAAPDELVLAANLLRGLGMSSQLVALHSFHPTFTTEVSRRPLASPVARLEVETRSVVTNLWHERITVSHEQAALLPLLDGSRDRAELLAAFRGAATVSAGDLELQLRRLAHAGLLVG
jgi:SAM-dependent methyltransferase